MYDFDSYEDQPTDEFLYGRCKKCKEIEELNGDDLCVVCEAQIENHVTRFPA